MPCPDFEQRLLEYDELSVAERVAVDGHIGECSHCRAFSSVLDDIDTALTAAFADLHVPTVFVDRVSERLRTRAPLLRPSMVPELLDATGWAGIVAIVLWLATFFVPGLDFSIPVAVMIGTLLLMAGFWVAYDCYGKLRRS